MMSVLNENTAAEAPPSYEAAAAASLSDSKVKELKDSSSSRPPPPPSLELAALKRLKGQRVILASASPRRKQLLAQIGIEKVETIPSSFAENLPKSLAPFEYVLQTATNKALAVYRREINNVDVGEPALIIAADTIVVSCRGQILEKPKSEPDHIAMLSMLRDTAVHQVYTAVVAMTPLESALDPGYLLETHVEETKVKFDPNITDDLILAYVKTREGADKAGGYGIQGIGAILIEKIDGSYDNVVGLPLRATLQLIEKVMTPEDEEDMYENAANVDIM